MTTLIERTRTAVTTRSGVRRGLLLACAAAAFGMAAVTDQPAHRVWGLVAGAGYLLLALTPLATHRAAPWLAGIAGGVVPLAVLVLARGGTGGPGPFAQPEVWVIEDAARRWLATGGPYPAEPTGGADGYFPYLPGMALFGMPRALAGDAVVTDARVWFALVTVAGVVAAVRAGRLRSPLAAWLVAGNPVVGITLATGGHDLAMAGLMVAALAAALRPGPRAAALAGFLAGLAATTKPTALPVLVVLLVLLARQGRAAPALAAAAVPVLVLLAPALVTPERLVEHVLTFPAGLAAVPSPAGSPLPGGWLAALPGGRWVALALLAGAALAVLVRLLVRPPLDVPGAARFAALALTVATLLAPSTRVGWLVVPALLAALAVTVRTGVTVRERTGAIRAFAHSVVGMDPVTERPPTVVKTDAEWRAQLSPDEYRVLRQAGTERAFAGEYTDTKTTGVYSCRACGAELFRSDTKFDSHCGWPSFFTPLAGDAVIERVDSGMGMRRVEVLCATCHSHLGHVFEGEGFGTPTDLRYCINSISLRLVPDA